jgi:hypothetical protein
MNKAFKLIVLSGLLVTLGIVTVVAQTNLRLKANIPFEFMVSGKTLPAGEYAITPQASSGVTAIENDETRDFAFALTNSVETLGYSDQSKLIFHRYGNQYFLSQIWMEGSSTGREVPMSKAEKEARQTASNHRDDVAILAMR